MNKNNLEKAIRDYKINVAAIRKEEIRAEREEQAKDKRFWKDEQKFSERKLGLYKNITEWKNEFIKTKQSYDLFDLCGDICLYYGGWGHKRPELGAEYSCWSRIYLEKSRDLRYHAGYKWMPGGQDFILNESTISKLTKYFIQGLHDHIKSGRVYKTLAQELKEK